MHAVAPDTGTVAQRESGKKLYQKKCAGCHGEAGDGQGPATPFLIPMPRDLTSGSFKIRTTPSGEMPTTQDLIEITRRGMPFTGMTPWSRLSDRELSEVVYYMKTFDEVFADSEVLVDPFPIPDAPPFSQGSAEKGLKIYEKNGCASCHGVFGKGDGLSAPTSEDASGKMIRPADLTRLWTFRGGGNRRDIFRTIYAGMDGTPMAAYGELIVTADLWHLVNYIYSMGDNDTAYVTQVNAHPVGGVIDLSRGQSIFKNAVAARLPVVGQIIEPGRTFFPGVHTIEVKAVYNGSHIALMLSWHDMSAEKEGKNSPAVEVPRFDPDAEKPSELFSDAVAVQFPSRLPQGFRKPYFLFGDSGRSVDIWFADLAEQSAGFFLGKGSDNITREDGEIEVVSNYKDGEWQVIFKGPRKRTGEKTFQEDEFIPVAFSVWDGFSKERGNTRGITSWYSLYMQPPVPAAPLITAIKCALGVLLLELLLVYAVRKKTPSPELRQPFFCLIVTKNRII
ncbi:c-type cytochrome [Fibrobacterota bacterium]